jgi:hypothetical protein
MMKKIILLLTALLCASAFAQDLPKIAVYVTGNVPDDEKSALGTRMLATLVNSGRYMGIERSASFLAEIEKEQVKQRSGDIDDGQISELGKQFGVKYVCIAAITPAFGSYQVSARIVDVETAEVAFIGEAFSPLKTADDLVLASDEVVGNMFGERAEIGAGGGSIGGATESQPAVRGGADFYFAPKYPIPGPKRTPLYGINLEFGAVWGKGTFLGADLGFGLTERGYNPATNLGITINYGDVYDLTDYLQLVYGVSAGFWGLQNLNEDILNAGIVGPFARLRWRFLELSYRGLFGLSYDIIENGDEESMELRGLSYNTQIMLGFHLEATGRFRPKEKKYDFYFAPKYQIPGPRATPSWGLWNAELGMIWGNGSFFSFDFGWGFSYSQAEYRGSYYYGDYSSPYEMRTGTVGVGMNSGWVYDLPADLQLAYGISAGFWYLKNEKEGIENVGIVGPFARLRWHVLELQYRGWIGHSGYDSQIMLGLHLSTSRRGRF